METTYAELLEGIKTNFENTLKAWTSADIPNTKNAMSKNITMEDWNRLIILLAQTRLYVEALYPVITGWVSAAGTFDDTLANTLSEIATLKTSKVDKTKAAIASVVGIASEDDSGLMSAAHVNQIVELGTQKVNKTTETKSLYGTDDSGAETVYRIGGFSTANAIVQRNSAGNIIVPYEPNNEHCATSKKYVDDADRELSARVDSLEKSDREQTSRLETKADATKAALVNILGYATIEQDGVMTSTQAANLATLVNLLRNDDADTTINTIREVLDAFANSSEGTYVANEFSDIKQSISDLKAVGLTVQDGMLCQIYNI